jgi:hypothetical protein
VLLLTEFEDRLLEGAMIHLRTASRGTASAWLRADLTDQEVAGWLKGDDWPARLAHELIGDDLVRARMYIRSMRRWDAENAKLNLALDEMIRNTSRSSPYNLPPWSGYDI